MDTETRRILARNVRAIREAQGLTIADLVRRTGLSQRQLNGLERAEKHARTDTLDKLSSALRLPVWLLLLPTKAADQLSDPDLVTLTTIFTGLPPAGRDQVSRVAAAEARYHAKGA